MNALLHFTDEWLNNMDQKKIPVVVLLDMSKAFDSIRHDLMLRNAPINVNPVGGGGVRARGGDLTNFKLFRSNSPGWETKGQSKVSKKPPPQGKKSKQTML